MRLRITFSKTGALRYIGHLDLNTIWERGTRRAGLPLAYSQGFHPQPKIHIAAALPLGFASRCEVLDMRLNEDMDLNELPNRLQAAMPPGIGIVKVESVDEHAPAIQTQVLSAEYEVTLTGAVDRSDLKRKIDEVLSSTSLPRERRNKKYDLRPLIEKLEMPSGDKILIQLAAREGATGRPEEVISVLGIALEDTQTERVGLIFQQ
jgi:radical SAM-linked protein